MAAELSSVLWWIPWNQHRAALCSALSETTPAAPPLPTPGHLHPVHLGLASSQYGTRNSQSCLRWHNGICQTDVLCRNSTNLTCTAQKRHRLLCFQLFRYICSQSMRQNIKPIQNSPKKKVFCFYSWSGYTH